MTVSTNAQGQFELRDVPPGAYFVSATRAGYLEIQHGQRRPRERGTAVELRAGETRERIDIALVRGSVLTGRVVDETGAPYPGVTVIPLALGYQLGARTYLPSGGTTTNDLGEYRIAGLQPGRYYLVANSGETWRNEKKETFGYAATLYPGARSIELAQALTLGIAEERLNSDFILEASRTARVRGRVVGPTGAPLGGEQVSMNRTITAGAVLSAGALATRTAADGSFEFLNVPPATYSLRSVVTRTGSAAATIVVNGVDVDDVRLVPRIGSSILGSFITDDGSPPALQRSALRVNLVSPPGTEALPSVRVFTAEDDWTVRITSVGGRFLFRIVGLPNSWMLDAVRMGERDITDTPFDVPLGGLELTDLQIVLTNRIGTITGGVTTADGKPTRDATVVIFAEDSALWGPASRFVRSTRPTADGTFSITGLPGGTYLAVVREFVTDGEWESKEFLEAARADGVRVTLSRGGSESVALKLR
jgi:hypothetical protein